MPACLNTSCNNTASISSLSDPDVLRKRAYQRECFLLTHNQFSYNNITQPTGSDYSYLVLKPDHASRPAWTCPDGTIYLETFHKYYSIAHDFFVAVAEPVARPEFLHEYKLTPYSLYAAVATNIDTEQILLVLERLSKNQLPDEMKYFVKECTIRYGKARLVLKHNRFYVESEYPSVLRELLRDEAMNQSRVKDEVTGDNNTNSDGFLVMGRLEEMEENLRILHRPEDDSENEEFANVTKCNVLSSRSGTSLLTTVAFQIHSDKVEIVKKRAIELDYPLMEEYDFRNDMINPNVPMDLKPQVRIRRYQERSLSKMFGNGRARSGIVVLPCGAGKTLTGVTAAQTIRKSVICLCTNTVSVLQWKSQFQLWTNISSDRISCFTSNTKDTLHSSGCVLITTYTMISYSGKRSDKSREIMDIISSREWGLMLMDEVHVVPAKMFRRVVGSVKAHCRLGLTATLVREDDLITDLNFLIGPKLYEANWMDLTAQGYLANVQCVEVWCPMTGPFMKEYLNTTNARCRQLMYVMNPRKLRAAMFLVKFHEKRGDKIIVFSDLVYSLKLYANMFKKPLIYGETPEKERQAILGLFRSTNIIQTICISKVGDTSIDLPDANVIIQVSSHFGSRRQEAQRLGRILRPKNKTQTSDNENNSRFNAFFYTLVSTDTQEMFYSSKRQQYLIDQGYTFKVLTNLCDKADEDAKKHKYPYSTPEEDRKLLCMLLASDMEMEKEQRSEDMAIRKNNPDGADLADARRTSGSTMAHISGGTGMKYKEIVGSTAKRHPLFSKRIKR